MAKKHCPYCDAPMVEYKHSLSKGLAKCLYRFVEAGGGPVNVYSELKFTHSQVCNFRKLRYWGLIEHSDKDDTRNGSWNLTQAGWQFVKGKTEIKKCVVTYRGEVRGFDGPTVTIQELTDGWWYKPDYIEHSKEHGQQQQLQLSPGVHR